MKLDAQRLERQRLQKKGTSEAKGPVREGRESGIAPRSPGAAPASGKLVPIRPAISRAKLAANRRNALRSTGPRTIEGKRRASLNARKHGLSSPSMKLSLSPVLGSECAATFDTVRQELTDDLQPRSPIEIWLVEHIANQLWRLMRAAGVERRLMEIAEKEEAAARETTEGLDVFVGRRRMRRVMSEMRRSPGPLKRASPGASPAEESRLSASEVLARAFGAANESHPMMLLARYERGMQSMLLRLLARLQMLKKRPNEELYSREDREAFANGKRVGGFSETWWKTGWPEDPKPPADASGAAVGAAVDAGQRPVNASRSRANPPDDKAAPRAPVAAQGPVAAPAAAAVSPQSSVPSTEAQSNTTNANANANGTDPHATDSGTAPDRTQTSPATAGKKPDSNPAGTVSSVCANVAPDETKPPHDRSARPRIPSSEAHNRKPRAAVKTRQSVVQSGRFQQRARKRSRLRRGQGERRSDDGMKAPGSRP